jgi:hypothetical protein
MTAIPVQAKNNAQGTLISAIAAADTTIPMGAGVAASKFPKTANGSANTAGDTNTLNSTGIQAKLSSASAGVGSFILNTTDGSFAVISSISTDSVTTTDLRGGTGDVWAQNDAWTVNPFVVTLNTKNTDTVGSVNVQEIDELEIVLIDYVDGDNLVCRQSNRGYNGTTAKNWSPSGQNPVYVDLLVEQSTVENIYKIMSDTMINKADDDKVVKLDGAQTITGNKTHTGTNQFSQFPTKSGSITPTQDNELTPKEYVDAVGASGGQVSFELGENLSSGDLVKVIDDSGAKVVAPLAQVTQDLNIETVIDAEDDNLKIPGGIAFNDSGDTAVSIYVEIITSSSPSSVRRTKYAVAGSVSGGDITWGTPVQIATTLQSPIAGSNDDRGSTICFDSNSGRFVVGYGDGEQDECLAMVLNVSGNTITTNTPVTLYSQSSSVEMDCVYDSNSQKIAFFHLEGAVVGTVSGTSISFGTNTTFSETISFISACFDSSENKIALYTYVSGSQGNREISVRVCTISTTNISFGATQLVDNAGGGSNDRFSGIDSYYNARENRVVCTFNRTGSNPDSLYSPGEISGNSVVLGTVTSIGVSLEGLIQGVCYDETHNVVYVSNGNNPPLYEAGHPIISMFSQSGNTLSFVSETEITTGQNNRQARLIQCASKNGYIASTWQYVRSPNNNPDYSIAGTYSRVFTQNRDNNSVVYGILQTTGVAGDNLLVAPINSTSFAHTWTAAQINSPIYIQPDFTIGTTSATTQIGKVIDTDKLAIIA